MAEQNVNTGDFQPIADFSPETDGTVAGAVLDMPDIDELEKKTGDRNADGTFKAKEPVEAEAKEEETEGADEKEPAQEAAEDDDEDEDYLEFTPEDAEEGAEPTRLKASEVLDGYKKTKELEAEVAQLKETPLAPPEYDDAIIQAAAKGQEYLQRLSQLEQMLQPRLPSNDLINPNSPNYDPEQFFHEQQAAEAQYAQLQQVQSERERVSSETNEQSSAAENARIAREQAKLKEFWPEVATEAGAERVRSEALAHYRLPADVIDSVTDSRFYAVLKDALEYRSMKTKAEAPVTVVKSKPKLVKSKGRDPKPKATQQAKKMARLSESNDIEDAASIIGDLL